MRRAAWFVTMMLAAVGFAAAADETSGGPAEAHPFSTNASRPPRPAGDPPADRLSEVAERIAAEEYHVTWQPRTHLAGVGAAWHAPNRAHGFRTYFTEAGPRVIPRDEAEPSWNWGLGLVGYGRGGRSRAVPAARLEPAANRIDYERGGISEWYVNSPRGMEQGFVLRVRPEEIEGELLPGEPPRGPQAAPVEAPLGTELVHLDLRLLGTLEPAISADGRAVDFRAGRGMSAVHYAELKVTDAGGRELPAWIEGFVGEGFGGLRIVFADEDAAYPVTVDPLATSPAWTAEGDQAGAQLGVSVATAGDVNADGYADVVVGANSYDNGQANEGRAFVYYGSASGLAATAAWTAESDQANAGFGQSVATAGDVNGDGYADVIVGATGYDNGEMFEGRAFIYHGSASGLAATAAWTAEGDQAGAQLGASVATAGDVNGDGYADVVVGAVLYDNDQFGEGRAFVYYGGASGLATSPAWTAEGDQANAWFGCSVATAGDVNGDGYSDVVVGALRYTNGEAEEGRAFVYQGSASGLAATASWTAESDQADAYFGTSVATAGDVNGDGYADVVVGANAYGNGAEEGQAFAYHGSASGLAATAAWTAESDRAGGWWGCCWVATAGDVNGDGYADVVVGADAYDNGEGEEGQAFVYHGSASGLAATAAWTAEGDQVGASFGHSVATAGDVNGDGYADVIVGAPFGETVEGRAFVYHGGPADDDNDGILDDGDGSGTIGDHPCTGGETVGCDDNCLHVANPDQADADGDADGDVCDNCPATSNPAQLDSDADCPALLGPGVFCGDACDACTDTDGDGFGDPGTPSPGCPEDNCPFVDNPPLEDTNGDGVINVNDDQPDFDHDGVGDACDVCPFRPFTSQVDRDLDGLGDGCDPFPLCPRECEIQAFAGELPPAVCAGCPGGSPRSPGAARDCIGLTPGGGPLGFVGFCIAGIPKPKDTLGFCPPWLAYVDQCCPNGVPCPGSEIRTVQPDGLNDLILPAVSVGLAGTDAFGFDGAIVGDLDGDLDPDLAVAAPGADAQGVIGAGSVLLVSSASGQLLSRWDGGFGDGLFGFALATHPAGLLVGAPFEAAAQGLVPEGTGTEPGAVYLRALSGATIRRFVGPAPGVEFGAAVAAFDDVDGDGTADVLVGAPGAGPSNDKPGSVWLLAAGDGSVRLTLSGLSAKERFGEQVATVDDLDGDGASELAVSAPMAGTAAGAEAGRVDVYSRQGQLLARIEGDVPFGRLGASLAAGPDGNADGVPDLLIGAPRADTSYGTQAGLVLLTSASGEVLARFSGEAGDHVGRSVVLSPDVNGDGLGDYVIASAFGGGGLGTSTYFFSGVDFDADGSADAGDNCLTTPNPSQADLDQDARGDACDCAINVPGTWEAPSFVTGLRVAISGQGPDYAELSWDSLAAQAGPDVTYDVVSGDVALLRMPGAFQDAVCAAVNAQGTGTTVYRAAPGPRQVSWYLVRGQNGCGGTYNSGAASQTGDRDTPLATAPGPCG